MASIAAASKGLTNNGLGGTIIYYDLEAYGFSSSACRQPVAAFMNGWVQRLHEMGNLAGGYGTRNSYVADWAYIPNVPDDVWPASWYATYYDPYASVTSIPWLDGLWVNHQRIRQYAGDHHESWGGVGMGIDSDVADGRVAMPPNGPQASPVIISSLSVQDAGWISATQGWLVTGGHLYWTSDRGNSWVDISPSSIQIAYFLPGGQAWALSNLDELQPAIYYSYDGGASWDSYPLTLPAVEWKPLQLQFNSPTQGWAVLQKVSSQAFQKAILLKTSDGGLTWQTYDLPIVGKINFSSQSEGWLLTTDQQQVFHTTTGGLSWQAAEPRDYPSVNAALPAGTAFSGWSTENLGWATTSNGSCVGEKGSPGFTCKLDNQLWQSVDSGKTWEMIPLPEISPNKR